MAMGRPRASQLERECSACGLTKPVSEFHKNGTLRGVPQYKTTCKPCRKAATKPDTYRPYHLKARYGITVDEYDELEKAQGGVCKICQRPETQRKRLAVDHCHTTGAVRGLLCTTCNAAIGHLLDDPEIIRRAADYVGGTLE